MAIDRKEAMASVTVFGPNLSGPAQRKGCLHVHAVGCGDSVHYGPGKKFGGDDAGWTIEAASRKDVVTECYPPGDFEYDADSEWQEFDDLYVAPCVKF